MLGNIKIKVIIPWKEIKQLLTKIKCKKVTDKFYFKLIYINLK